jgi:hypothetical protein
MSLLLKEHDGLFELEVYPLSGDLHLDMPIIDISLENDPKLWDQDDSEKSYSHMKSPTKLGAWRCQMLWTPRKVGLQGVQELRSYDQDLNEFCDSYFVPPSQPPAKRTYRTTDVEDMAELSLRFMGIGTDRLRHTLERSRGLGPATKKKGENVSVVPPLNFPQGKWKTGKTPRVAKNKVKYLHRASVAEVCFTDTFETADSTYKYGQAVVEYRSRFGDVFPIRSRKKVGWAIGEFCCRHFTPLILIRDNIAENAGGDLMDVCHRRGIKSAFSCPYTPQQDYAEGYLGRVVTMASFAMVLSGAPLFMWRWAIQCATFINNITATFYRKEKVWATPWEILHGEPFPDSSVVVPFGCAALVLLNKDEREKFKGTCAMMIFIHYALNHPLYTYALFSPRTKKVVFRQDVIFLPHVFPMREARAKGGLHPDGEELVAYRSPQAPGTKVGEEMSFGGWTADDPIPTHQDHVTGYPLMSPMDETALTSEEKPLGWPSQQPSHPAFGPQSVVKVNRPWGEIEVSSGEMDGAKANEVMDEGIDGESGAEPSDTEVQREPKTSRPKRVVPSSKEGPKAATERRPVGQRWFYEPVQPILGAKQVGREVTEVSRQDTSRAIEHSTREHLGVEGKEVADSHEGGDGTQHAKEPLDQHFESFQDDGHFVGSRQSKSSKAKKTDEMKIGNDVSFDKMTFLNDVSCKSKPVFEFERKITGIENRVSSFLPGLGQIESLPCKQFDGAEDNEATACAVQGLVFHDEELGWCTVTNWGVDYGTNVIFYAPVECTDPGYEEQHASLAQFLTMITQTEVVHRWSNYRASRKLAGFSCIRDGVLNMKVTAKRHCSVVGTMLTRVANNLVPAVKSLSARTMRKILKAQETLFKYGTLIPRSDREAELSPEAVRWKSGRQLEWLRLLAAKTFETDWTWDRIKREYPAYQKSEIGHMFYIYDYKYSGEHRVRLVFDGSRQSPNTYNITYAPTVRAESVRLFHLYAVEYGWSIKQYDVPQAFLRSDADCTIFVYPPKGQSDFPGQVLKLSKMLYGSKQAAALWFNLLNTFIIKLGFIASPMDPCFYRRKCITGTGPNDSMSDAIIILHVDDMRVAATPDVMEDLHGKLYAEFQITTSDSGRFLGMDTEYDLKTGVFKMHMATYIESTVQRFENFDLSKGIPYRELVGSLLWIVLCVMGTELLRVKDLARRSNNYTMDDYKDALRVLKRIVSCKDYGIVFRRGGAGCEYVPASSRLGGGLVVEDGEASYSIGDSTEINELEENNLYKLDAHEDEHLDIEKHLAPTNSRFTKVAYTDASFAVGETKQSVSGFVILINGVPILWGSLKQTIVVDSTCSAEYVAASVCCKQILQAENMAQFLAFTCPRPYKMYTDSQACLKIATNASKMGMVRHLEIRYHLVRCIILRGDIQMAYCITEEMLADLFTKIVDQAQDKRLAIRFYNDCVM